MMTPASDFTDDELAAQEGAYDEPRRPHVDIHGKPHIYVVPGAPGYRDILIAADLAAALADPLTERLGDGPAAQLLTRLAAAAGGYRDAGTPPPMLLLRVERGKDEGDV